MIIDSREGYKLKQQFKEFIPHAKEETLQVGDYIVGNFIIERKEIGDFLASYTSNKLQRQLYDMCQTNYKPILVITGNYNEYIMACLQNKIQYIPYNAFIKMIAHLNYSFNINILQIENYANFATLCLYLENLEDKIQNEFFDVFKHDKKSASKDDIRTAMLSCIPGISWNKAKQILNKVNWNDLIDEDWDLIEEELKELNGIGPKTIKAIFDNLRN